MPSDDRASSDRRGTPVEPSRQNEGDRADGVENDERGEQRATKEYPTRDLSPVGGDLSEEEWTDMSDEERRIALFTMLPIPERDPAILVPTGSGGRDPGGSDPENHTTADGMDGSTCAEIRETMNDALTAREVVENYPTVHTSKIMRHAYGECNHTIDTPATASPQIGPDECLSMRDDYRQGDRVGGIAETWARSENTVTRHIFGRCSHDSRPRDVSPSRVAVEECDRIRRTYAGNEKVSVREVACATRLRREVVATHLFGYCRHGDEDPGREAADDADATLWDGRDA